ncbi:MAG: CotH kinase family protein, partial [Paramuribaculum sp.]|nr:CotH kinase family protein [Paramuribaculum sp.]
NEITKNMDADFSTSCFMNLKRGDKLKMGPLWDFDLAMGNVYDTQVSSPDGLWVIRSQWYSRLFQDPAFVARVKDRFNYFYSRQEDIFKEINLNAQYLKYSVRENNNKWNILYTSIGPNTDVWGSYVNEVQQMKNWLTQRFENLKKEFSRL